MAACVCQVYLLDAPTALDRPFDYLLPEALLPAEEDPVGRIVAVPFGWADRLCYAAVFRTEQEAGGEGLKSIFSVAPAVFSLTPAMRETALFLREFTLCSLGEAVRALLPAFALGKTEERYYPADTASEDPVCLALREKPGQTAAALEKALGQKAAPRILARLRREGKIRRRDVLHDAAAPKVRRTVLAGGDAASLLPLLAEKGGLRSAGQRQLLGTLLDLGQCEESELLDRSGGTRTQLRALYEKGVLTYREEEVPRLPYGVNAGAGKAEPIVLSRAQGAAYESLHTLAFAGAPKAALLYGVTGSGKTKVMMRLLDDVLAAGRRAIVMVPEISLTPQTVSLFCGRYGAGVAVMHSALSAGERYDAFRRCRTGEVRLVIGTRSAVFAPLENVGLIVLDEEHEHTYKSDRSPRYHARDVAAFRCGQDGGLMLLSSATPSVESFYKAKSGKYALVPLRERFGGAKLPKTEIVDLREELRAGNTSPLSDRMLQALTGTLARGEQAILFCARRGYYSALHCKSCGEAVMCPNCSVSLTYHTSYTGAYLLCHTCGYKAPPPSVCPACGQDALSYRGFGTQKAEGEIAALCGGRVMRMDADTTAGKASYDRMLEQFRAGEADILLGTQMVAKGHDFPRVTLSGVLLADASLYVSDYRAGERTFSLLTQVVGRAGRSGTEGEAVIQTFCPEHDVIRLAATQDYDLFYQREIALRRAALFPPFCDLVRLTLSGAEEGAVVKSAAGAKEYLTALARQEMGEVPFQLFGPLESEIYKSGGKYRLNFLIKCRNCPAVRRYLRRFLQEYAEKAGRGIALSADINPA